MWCFKRVKTRPFGATRPVSRHGLLKISRSRTGIKNRCIGIVRRDPGYVLAKFGALRTVRQKALGFCVHFALSSRGHVTSAGRVLLGLLFCYEAGRGAIGLRFTGDRAIRAYHVLFEFESVPVRIASPGAEKVHCKVR
jgi:hypothetical protein